MLDCCCCFVLRKLKLTQNKVHTIKRKNGKNRNLFLPLFLTRNLSFHCNFIIDICCNKSSISKMLLFVFTTTGNWTISTMNRCLNVLNLLKWTWQLKFDLDKSTCTRVENPEDGATMFFPKLFAGALHFEQKFPGEPYFSLIPF